MTAPARNSILAAIGALLGNLALLQLVADRRLLIGLIVIATLSALIGVIVRWRGIRLLTASWISLVSWLISACAAIMWACRPFAGGLWQRLAALTQDTIVHMEVQTAPMSPHDGVLVLLLLIGVLVTWLSDVFFVAGQFVVASLVVIITPMLIVIFVPGSASPAWLFAAVLLAWTGMAIANTYQESQRWGNLVPADQVAVTQAAKSELAGSRLGFQRPTMLSTAGWLVIPAIVLALIVGLSVPPNAAPRVKFSQLQRSPIELTDPTIRLHENLRRPSNQTVLRYRTNQAGGVYLRTTALVDVQNAGWALSDMKLQRGYPERVPGLDYAIPAVKTEIQLEDFETIYLPAPYAPLHWDVAGRWSFDPLTMTVLSTARRGEQTTVDMKYVVESTTGGPDYEQLSHATAGLPTDADQTMQLPDQMPVEITELAQQLTRSATSDGEKALALQDFLRDETRFSYSLNTPAGSGMALMMNFLFQDRSGYCIHFASAMALMARSVGIASRVAIGFTPGTKLEDGSYQVTAHDMHAWPELYFDGLGWVRFEPTVSVASAPAYTSAAERSLPQPEPIEPQPLPDPTLTPTPTPSDPDDTQEAERTEPARDYSALWRWMTAVIVLAALAASPTFLRRRARARRLSASGPQAVNGAWTELAASAIDFDKSWPSSSPRVTAEALATELDEPTSAALQRLAIAQEETLYGDWREVDEAHWQAAGAQAQQDLEKIVDHWSSEPSDRRTVLARVLPASLWAKEIRQLDAASRTRK